MSAANPWSACVTYLESFCNPMGSLPYRQTDYRYAFVLWCLAACAKAETILEIGLGPDSCSGMTFAHYLGTHAEGRGVLWSVDIEPSLPKAQHKATAERLGVSWRFLYGDSLASEVQLPDGFSADVVYIDGAHDAAHAIGDLMKYAPRCRKGGYIIIDDFPPQPGVGEGRREIDEYLGPGVIHLAHEAPAGNGRLVYQRPL